jgi:hypothetical protein
VSLAHAIVNGSGSGVGSGVGSVVSVGSGVGTGVGSAVGSGVGSGVGAAVSAGAVTGASEASVTSADGCPVAHAHSSSTKNMQRILLNGVSFCIMLQV